MLIVEPVSYAFIRGGRPSEARGGSVSGRRFGSSWCCGDQSAEHDGDGNRCLAAADPALSRDRRPVELESGMAAVGASAAIRIDVVADLGSKPNARAVPDWLPRTARRSEAVYAWPSRTLIPARGRDGWAGAATVTVSESATNRIDIAATR
jgi:hypothetical protein